MTRNRSLRSRLQKRAGWELSKLNDRLLDWRLGVNTIDRLPGTYGADLASKTRPNEATSYRALDAIVRSFALQADDVLVDIGCGFGRAVCYFASRGVGRRFVGVELLPEAAEQARINANRIRGAPISIITGDATEQTYGDATVIYFYNPFDGEVMGRVLARIEAERTRELRLCYVNPVERAVFEAAGWLAQTHSFYVPYRSGRAEVTIWRSR